MKLVTLHITNIQNIAHQTYEMTFENAYIAKMARPGQFLHLQITGQTLRRPISIASTNIAEGTTTIVFKVFGEGTRQLANYQPGMTVDALGPCGQSFPLPDDRDATILLIGGGVGVPPLHFLANDLSQKYGREIISVLGFQSLEDVFYLPAFKSFGKTIVMTNDGTFGEKGLVTEGIQRVGHFTQYYACGPTPMLRSVMEQLSHKKGYISLEERMGCGVGACFACVIPTPDGSYQKICQDGPVFAAKEVLL